MPLEIPEELREEVPEGVRRKFEELIEEPVEHPDEDGAVVKIAVSSDMNLDGEYTESWLLATDQWIVSFNPNHAEEPNIIPTTEMSKGGAYAPPYCSIKLRSWFLACWRH